MPNVAYAVAISAATTPPPMIARLAGASWALVASREVHGRASARPGMSGMSGSEPVLTTTACVAVSADVAPSASVTSTVRSPVSRPCPRITSMPAPCAHSTCEASFQSCANSLRRANTAATSIVPVTACFEPFTR